MIKHWPPADFINPRRYRAGAQDVDTQIAQVLNTLKERGVLDKTVVVITAEHGVEFNDTGKGYWGAGSSFSQQQFAGAVDYPLAGYASADH
jgi:uncharacterized protein